MGWACGRHRENRTHVEFWWGKLGGGSLGRSSHRREVNIRLELEETGMTKKTTLFWVITHRGEENPYRRFGTTYLVPSWILLKMGWIGCTEN